MKYFDNMNRYGMEINEENGRYLLKYDTGNHIGRVDILEISKEHAQEIRDAYANLDGMDIYKSEVGKAAVKKASTVALKIIQHYQNKRDGLI